MKRVLLWRWFSGHPMHGKYMSNATWFHRGSKALHPTGRVSRWHHLPRSVRAAVRTTGTLVTLTSLFGLLVARSVTVTAWEVILTAGAVTCSVMAVRWVVRFGHHRRNVKPLHVSLGPALGIPPERRASDWLTIPRNYATAPDSEIAVQLPDEFIDSRDSRALVETAVIGKLALEDCRPEWQMAGHPRVVFHTSAPPPDKVLLDAVLEAIKKAKETEPVLGLGRGSKVIGVDLENDSPHIMFSMGSGAGKSVATRALAVQVLHNGGIVLILDIKRVSHTRWARGLPNVRYCRSIESIHEACLWLTDEIDNRNELVDADEEMGTDKMAGVPRLLVLCEEMNATVNRLRAYWRKTKGPKDPNESPAVEALGDMLFMGRQVRINAAAVAQMFSARTAGGPEARENMGTRILGRYTMNNWRMLVPEIWPMPKCNRKPGRVQVCSNGEAQETQVVFFADADAKAWALSGTVTPFEGGRESLERISNAPVITVEAPEAMGLKEACARGPLQGMTYEGARRALQRDALAGEAPEHVRVGANGEKEYDVADLRAWVGNRPRAKVDV